MSLKQKENKLKSILKSLTGTVVAFSGGVDSTYLLFKAREALGNNVLAVTAVSETYSEQEKNLADQVAREMKVMHMFIYTQELLNKNFASNPPERCYYCKTELYSQLKELARNHGYIWVCDGANSDDTRDFRPGQRAAREMGIRSPLQEAQLTKDDIRELSRKEGLPTWNKPAEACFSSRIPYGETITEEKLRMISAAEKYLKSLGHKVVRVRCHQKTARLEVAPQEIPVLVEKRNEIVKYCKGLGFIYVALDLEGYRSGSMNELLEIDVPE